MKKFIIDDKYEKKNEYQQIIQQNDRVDSVARPTTHFSTNLFAIQTWIINYF